MILQNKNAIIYGAGGSLGGAVAKAFASAGAKVFLTGRSLPSVQKTADEIPLRRCRIIAAFKIYAEIYCQQPRNGS